MERLPTTQHALKVRSSKEAELNDACPLPVLEDDEILVRVRCVAINPVDVKMLDLWPKVGATVGCEFSGDVVRVGSNVKNTKLKNGVAVFGCVWGNHPDRPENGAFADFVAVAGDLVYLLPPHFSYEQGASLGVALATVGMAVYSQWPLPLPFSLSDIKNKQSPSRPFGSPVLEEEREKENGQEARAAPPHAGLTPSLGARQYVLVYGGSTVCGAMALQMLRRSGLIPVCTCSPRNFTMVKKLGAEEAFDYHSPTCGDDIRHFTNNTIAYVLDCITSLDSTRICYASMGRAGGKYMGLDPIPLRAHTRRDIKPEYILVYTIFGKVVNLPRPFGRPARPKDRAFAESWYQGTQTLINSLGEIRPHPLEIGRGGLQDLVKGLDRMRKGDVHGVKLVYLL